MNKKIDPSFNIIRLLSFSKIKRYAVEILKLTNFGFGKMDPLLGGIINFYKTDYQLFTFANHLFHTKIIVLDLRLMSELYLYGTKS